MVKPKICLTLTGKTLQEDAEYVKKYASHIDIAELRVDHLDESEELRFLVVRWLLQIRILQRILHT